MARPGRERKPVVVPCSSAMIRLARARELVLFILFGATAALTTLSVGWVLYDGRFPIHVSYWFATGVAATAGLFVNFGLNYTFNFKFRDRPASQQFSTFCLVAGFGIFLTSALSEAFLYVLDRIAASSSFHLSNLTVRQFAAHVMAVGVVALYSFPAHRLISFNVGIVARLRQLQLSVARSTHLRRESTSTT
jgi:putative flippase GtrA